MSTIYWHSGSTATSAVRLDRLRLFSYQWKKRRTTTASGVYAMQFYSPATQTAEIAQKTSWGLIDPVTYTPSIFCDALAGIPEADAKSGAANDMASLFRSVASNMSGQGIAVSEAV